MYWLAATIDPYLVVVKDNGNVDDLSFSNLWFPLLTVLYLWFISKYFYDETAVIEEKYVQRKQVSDQQRIDRKKK